MIRLDGSLVTKLYDSTGIPGAGQPMAAGLQSNEIERLRLIDEAGTPEFDTLYYQRNRLAECWSAMTRRCIEASRLLRNAGPGEAGLLEGWPCDVVRFHTEAASFKKIHLRWFDPQSDPADTEGLKQRKPLHRASLDFMRIQVFLLR